MRKLVIYLLLVAFVLFGLVVGCEKVVDQERKPAPPSPPVGTLIGYGSCKFHKMASVQDSISPDQDCIEYQYDGENLLLLRHINAAFNCCPESITADVSIEDSVIIIEERHSFLNGNACFCNCLYDLDFEIRNLEPGEYTIKVIEILLEPSDEPLEFTVDLPYLSSSGSYCVSRDHYPWL